MILALLAGMAMASPTTLTHQGRLTDTLGVPTNGSQSLTIALYTAQTGGSAVWSETDPVELADGYYSTILGDTASLTGLDFANVSYWVGVTVVGGSELTPRTPLTAVPTALSVQGGGAAAQTGPLVFGRVHTGGAIGWVPFQRPLQGKPIIATTVVEYDNSGPTDGRLMQITRNGFGIQTYNCSATDAADSLSYLAMTSGQHTIDGHLFQAGETGPTSSSAFSVTFPVPFSQVPVVFLMSDESRSNSGAVSCRMETLTTTAMNGRCWNLGSTVDAESVHWIATEPTPSSGISVGGRTLFAGHDTPTATDHDVTLPFTSSEVPEVVLLQPENFGTSGGATSSRLQNQSFGNRIDTRSYACSADTGRTAARLHWLVVE